MAETSADTSAAQRWTVHVKQTSTSEKISIEVEPECTVQELKDQLAERGSKIPAPEQRLIYKGQILKNERTLSSYGIANDHVLHLVKGKAEGSAAASSGGGAAPAGAIGGGSPAIPAGMGDLFGGMFPGMGGAAGGAPGGDLSQMMAQAMNNPMMQSMMSNPELLRGMLQGNPAVRQLMESNPELAQALNDPALLRQSMQLAANPNLLREHMRTNDRALSNIEGMPEGFNALRRMYETVQEPLANATTGGDASGAGNPIAGLLGLQGAGAAASSAASSASTTGNAAAGPNPNANPLPNPWAPAGTGAAGAGGVPAGLGGFGLPPNLFGGGAAAGANSNSAANPLAALLGGMGGAGGGAGMGGMGLPGNVNPEAAMAMLQNPAMQGIVQSMMSTPGMMESLINQNPQMRAMVDANPGLRNIMSNPQTMQAMLNPANMQAMLDIQRSMSQLQGNPALANMFGLPGSNGSAAGGGNPAGPGPDLAALLGAFGGGGLGGLGAMFGGMPGAGVPPVADPEIAYATQLQQLADMGFIDRAEAIAALQQTGGNVQAAVERLL